MEPIYSLQPGTQLQGNAYRYRIERTLGHGSFGITYLATGYVTVQGPLGKMETQVPVAIKEFFMQELNSRDATGSLDATSDGSLVQRYARKFSVEARNLSRIQHPGIVSVLDFIDANNTFYYVMEFIEGSSLDDYVCSRGGLPEEEALEGIRQIGEALAYMHTHKMLHLDLKPKNVMRKPDGSLLLIDFGLSKQYDGQGEPESSTTIGLGTPGYAPIEQADTQGGHEFSPTLDVYALGATFFKMLTGETPPKASDIINFGLPLEKLRDRGISEASIAAVKKAMQFRRTDRTPTVEAFLQMLPGATASPADEERTTVLPAGKPRTAAAKPTLQRPVPQAKAAPAATSGGRQPSQIPASADGKAGAQDKAKGNAIKKKAAITAIALLLIGGTGAAVYFGTSGGSKDAATPPVSTTDTVLADPAAAIPDTAALPEREPDAENDSAAAAESVRPIQRHRHASPQSSHATESHSPSAATTVTSNVSRPQSGSASSSGGSDLEKKPKKKWKQKFKKLFHKKNKD